MNPKDDDYIEDHWKECCEEYFENEMNDCEIVNLICDHDDLFGLLIEKMMISEKLENKIADYARR